MTDAITPERYQKTDTLTLLGYDLDGKTLEEAIIYLQSFQIDPKYTQVTLDYDDYGDYNDRYDLAILGRRFETDTEYHSRLEQADITKEYRRKQYENLKKEFES